MSSLTPCNRILSAWGDVDRAIWRPTWIFGLLSLPVASPFALGVLQWIWRGSLLLSAVGFFTRLNTLVAAVLGFYLLGLPNNFIKVNHDSLILVVILFLLAASRCGDALSLDSRLWPSRVPHRGEYRWPIRAVWLTLGLVFLAAGISKIRHGPWAWLSGESLSYYLQTASFKHATRDKFRPVDCNTAMALRHFGRWDRHRRDELDSGRVFSSCPSRAALD